MNVVLTIICSDDIDLGTKHAGFLFIYLFYFILFIFIYFNF